MSTTPHRGFFIVVDKNHYNIIVYIYFITPVRKQFTTKSLDKVDRRAARLPNIYHLITLGKRELSFSICILNVNKTNSEAFIIILFLLMPILLRLEYMRICCLGERHNIYLWIQILLIFRVVSLVLQDPTLNLKHSLRFHQSINDCEFQLLL